MRPVFIIFILVLVSFGIGFESACAPCYGTNMPGRREIFLGIQTHSIFKRYLEDERGKLRTTQHFLLLSYGVTDWLSIDLKGGMGHIKQRPTTSCEVDYPSGFSGGYGFRVRLYQDTERKIKAVFGFQHISVHPPHIHLQDQKHKAFLDDWQVSLLISKDFLRSTPYIGTKWSRIDYVHWIGQDRKRRMSDLTKFLGGIFGLGLPLDDKTYLNIESHFFDEEAISVSFLYKF
jgi:nitrate reductase NapE component